MCILCFATTRLTSSVNPCFKWSSFFFNACCLAAGILIFATSLMISLKPAYSYLFFNDNQYYSVILVIGAFLGLAGILGCVGALSRNSCLLYIFSICTGLVIAAEVFIGFFIYEYSPDFISKLQRELKQGMELDYGENATITRRIDEIQRGWRCCGLNAHSSWSNSKYGGPPVKKFIKQRDNYFVPKTCCIDENSLECQLLHRKGISEKSDVRYLHKKGCLPLVVPILDYYSQFAYVAITVVIVCQAIAMILSTIMAYRLRKLQVEERPIKSDLYTLSQTSQPVVLPKTTSTESHQTLDSPSAFSSVRESQSSVNLSPTITQGTPLSSLV